MNALGSSSFPFAMSVLAAVLNISGNILSVTVLNMGVAGVAWSTVLSNTIVCLVYIIKLRGSFSKLGVKKGIALPSISMMRESLHFSLPTGFQQLLTYISIMLLGPVINALGPSATAANVVVNSIYHLIAKMFNSSAKTLSSYTSQCLGREKYDQLQKGVKLLFVQNMVITIIPVLIFSIFAVPICSAFFPAGFTGEPLSLAIRFSGFYLPFIIFNVTSGLFHSFFRGIGAATHLLVACTVGSASRLILSFVLSLSLGMEGVFIGWVLSWIIETCYSFTVYIIRFRNPHMLKAYIINRNS
jgi:Na+-driven multidrug efflux pump